MGCILVVYSICIEEMVDCSMLCATVVMYVYVTEDAEPVGMYVSVHTYVCTWGDCVCATVVLLVLYPIYLLC